MRTNLAAIGVAAISILFIAGLGMIIITSGSTYEEGEASVGDGNLRGITDTDGGPKCSVYGNCDGTNNCTESNEASGDCMNGCTDDHPRCAG